MAAEPVLPAGARVALNMAQLRGAPAAALWPGLCGLLPFVACALWLLAGIGVWRYGVQLGLVSYGALILTFVGAIHWGVALMAAPGRSLVAFGFVWSVIPALWGWAAMAAMIVLSAGFVPALGLLAVGFIAQLVVDYRVAAARGLPAWYLPLRSVLTSVVLLTLLLASLAMAMSG